jgi:hypothetical protein
LLAIFRELALLLACRVWTGRPADLIRAKNAFIEARYERVYKSHNFHLIAMINAIMILKILPMLGRSVERI